MSDPAFAAIRKRFVPVGSHRIHYREAGEGPAIVMLHDSPRSSRLHLDTMARLAGRFRVLALDTPGYGNSSPIGGEAPTIEAFGRLLGATLHALGLDGAPIYATHTSAKIALAHSVETRVPPAMLLLDGLSIPDAPPDEAFIAAYMRPFRVDPDGAYLAAERSRMRDMLTWFPWFDRRPANRLAIDMPPPEWIDDYMLDLLSAGPHYSDAYAAAMRYDPRPALRRLGCPTTIGARADDVLFRCLDLLPPDMSASVRVARLAADREAWLAWIAGTLADGASSPAPRPIAPDGDGPSYVDLPHGQMLVHRAGTARPGRPLLILEAPTILHARLWQDALGDERPTLLPELPGYGESGPLDDPSVEAFADAIAAMASALRIDMLDVLAIGLAGPLAGVLAERHPALVASLVFDGVAASVPDAARLCPAFARDEAGGHLHRIRHMLREGELRWPWYDGHASAARRLAPCLAGEPLHRALLDILKQPAHYGDAARAASGCAPATPVQPALLFAMPDDPGYDGVAALAARLGDARVVPRPADIAAAAELLKSALDGRA